MDMRTWQPLPAHPSWVTAASTHCSAPKRRKIHARPPSNIRDALDKADAPSRAQELSKGTLRERYARPHLAPSHVSGLSLALRLFVQKHRPPPLHRFHRGRRVAVGNEQATVKNLHAGVGNLVVVVEAASHAHRSDGVGESMVHVVVEHLVPPVGAAEDVAHDLVHPDVGGAPFRLGGLAHAADAAEKVLPRMGDKSSPTSQTQDHSTQRKAQCFTRLGNHLLQNSLLHLPPGPASGMCMNHSTAKVMPV